VNSRVQEGSTSSASIHSSSLIKIQDQLDVTSQEDCRPRHRNLTSRPVEVQDNGKGKGPMAARPRRGRSQSLPPSSFLADARCAPQSRLRSEIHAQMKLPPSVPEMRTGGCRLFARRRGPAVIGRRLAGCSYLLKKLRILILAFRVEERFGLLHSFAQKEGLCRNFSTIVKEVRLDNQHPSWSKL
jgi:hypothetical protein